MRAIDLQHLGTPRVIAAWEVDGVLIDPGPATCLDVLLPPLGGGDAPVPRAILLTHIHFDHAGATGALLRRWPEVPVYLHERGARHMADPERLVKSATRLYGEEGMARLWGEVTPVPEANLHPLEGGETLLDGAYRVAYTPGHASHHVSYLHEASGRAFVGDVAGVRVDPCPYVMAPTPPPDLDVEAWEGSLDRIAEGEPSALALTHFGGVDDAPAQLAAIREALHAQVELAQAHDEAGFVAVMGERLEASAGEHVASYRQAAPLEHLWQGVERWAAKRRDAA